MVVIFSMLLSYLLLVLSHQANLSPALEGERVRVCVRGHEFFTSSLWCQFLDSLPWVSHYLGTLLGKGPLTCTFNSIHYLTGFMQVLGDKIHGFSSIFKGLFIPWDLMKFKQEQRKEKPAFKTGTAHRSGYVTFFVRLFHIQQDERSRGTASIFEHCA